MSLTCSFVVLNTAAATLNTMATAVMASFNPFIEHFIFFCFLKIYVNIAVASRADNLRSGGHFRDPIFQLTLNTSIRSSLIDVGFEI